MAIAVLIVTVIGLIISLWFNVLQSRGRKQDREDRARENAERDRKEAERLAEQRRKEEAPPDFCNFGGTPGPIRISGVQHSVQGPFMDLWGIVTIVNRTNVPTEISALRLILNGKECPIKRFFFRLKSNPTSMFENISLEGNHKEDYEIHFMLPDDNYPTPPSCEGELLLSSSNHPGEFSVKVLCP